MMEINKAEAMPRRGDALVVVDVQRDFLPGGRLAVPAGDRVLQPLNRCIDAFAARSLPIVATRDWHPHDHFSFQPQGGRWPPHCVAGSPGAALAPELHLPANVLIIDKGIARTAEGFSAFDDTRLGPQLRAAGVDRLFVGGLATDYCVLHTVLGACSLGFAVVLLVDAIAPVDSRPGDGARAIDQMEGAGAKLATTDDVLAEAFNDPGRRPVAPGR